MFSFFPCLPKAESKRGFRRPAIKVREVINPNLKMGLKITEAAELPVARESWKRAAEQVVKAGLCLGVSAELPEYM
jgi:hypothetical protein